MTRLAAIIALAALGTLSACGPGEPDETRIREAVAAMARAVEEGRPDDFLQRVSREFTGDDGAWDRHRVRQYLLGQALQNRNRPDIDAGVTAIEMFDDRARATVEADIRGEGRWLPGGGARYRFETGWRLEDGEWRIIRADWQRLDR